MASKPLARGMRQCMVKKRRAGTWRNRLGNGWKARTPFHDETAEERNHHSHAHLRHNHTHFTNRSPPTADHTAHALATCVRRRTTPPHVRHNPTIDQPHQHRKPATTPPPLRRIPTTQPAQLNRMAATAPQHRHDSTTDPPPVRHTSTTALPNTHRHTKHSPE